MTQMLMQYVYEYVFGAREFIFDIRFDIWPILREMGVKKGIFKVKNGQKHFCQKNNRNVHSMTLKICFCV